jgi:hypothetical protein
VLPRGAPVDALESAVVVDHVDVVEALTRAHIEDVVVSTAATDRVAGGARCAKGARRAAACASLAHHADLA